MTTKGIRKAGEFISQQLSHCFDTLIYLGRGGGEEGRTLNRRLSVLRSMKTSHAERGGLGRVVKVHRIFTLSGLAADEAHKQLLVEPGGGGRGVNVYILPL